MRYKIIVDINQEQRDDLIKRFQTPVPNSDNRYRIILSATETQRLTMLDDLLGTPTETIPVPVNPVPGDCPTYGCKLECDCFCHDHHNMNEEHNKRDREGWKNPRRVGLAGKEPDFD